jgi:hypothetical protein
MGDQGRGQVLLQEDRSFSPQRHEGTQSFSVRFVSLWFKLKLMGYLRQPALVKNHGLNQPKTLESYHRDTE